MKEKIEYTPEQQKAINTEDSSVIVSAAAGSGKTAVLTERVIRLICDPENGIDADKIIVVTFTKDAAAEMKKRIESRLREIISESVGDRYRQRYLVKQQILLQKAKISTINSFCFDVLRDNITDQGITSGFEIIDEKEERVIKIQAVDELFEWYSENGKEEFSRFYDLFCLKDRKVLTNVILNMDRFLESLAFAEKWLDTAVAESSGSFAESVYSRKFNDYVISEIKSIYTCFRIMRNSVPGLFCKNKSSEDFIIHAENNVELFGELAEKAAGGGVPDDIESFLERIDEIPVSSGELESSEYNKIVKKTDLIKYEKAFENVKKRFESVCSYIKYAEKDFEESGEIIKILVGMVRRFRKIVMERKCAKNAISYSDGERLLLEILCETDENGNIFPSDVAKNISQTYSLIMVDEYQDSNNKQDMIFKLISRNCRNDSGNLLYGDNVFLVGDVKQSIYRFRLANPDNFKNAMKTAERFGTDEESRIKPVFLNENFRSSRGVIDFINFVFGRIMTEGCGEIAYTEKQRLYFGAKKYSDYEELPCIITFPSRRTNIEPDVTAQKIAEMIEAGEKASDFCILVRTNTEIKRYTEALRRRGIAAKGAEDSGYLESREIVIIFNLLKIIANPLKEIPLTSVMVSPLYMFTIDEIAFIKSLDREKQLYRVLLGIIDGEYPEADGRIVRKCADFINDIKKFRSASITMPISSLINMIYDDTDFISFVQICDDKDEKVANLRIFVQYAKKYEKFSSAENNNGLSGFIRYISKLAENDDYEKGKIAITGDFVTVQTYHKSKGLEYPYVFLCGTSREFRLGATDREKGRYNAQESSVIFSEDGRTGFIVYDKKLVRRYKMPQYAVIAEEAKRSSVSEEMRLLYVGMTRAKKRLFINLSVSKDNISRLMKRYRMGDDFETVVAEQTSFSAWLWLCLFGHSGFKEIAKNAGIKSIISSSQEDEKIFVSEHRDFDGGGTDGEKAAATVVTEPVDEIVENIKSMVGAEYDKTLSAVTAKLSVTQIVKKSAETEEDFMHLKRPKFLLGEKKLTGAERGTAVHTFFQYCDFSGTMSDIPKEIERLRNLGYINEAEAKSISPRTVAAFFESDIFRRLKSSVSYEREKKFLVATSQLRISGSLLSEYKSTDNMINGIVDLMFEESDGIVIVDYKTDSGLDEGGLKERYRAQLEIYRAAIELITGKIVKEIMIYSTRLGKAITI